jgi:hypothetical protein
MAQSRSPYESLQSIGVKNVGNISHPSFAVQFVAIATHDTGRLLTTVLEAVKA